MSDHYAVLGVGRQATSDEIKAAYRKLARSLHPDVNPTPEAAEKFKDVTRAFEVLSSPEKRRLYDMGGDQALGGGGMGAGFAFSDIFETIFGQAAGASRGPIPRQQPGQDALIRMDVDLREAVFGTVKPLEFDTAVTCGVCEGSCCRPGAQPATCTACGGHGMVQRMARSLLGQVMTTAPCPTCQGHGTTLTDPCVECSGEGRVRARRKVDIKIPAGVYNGVRIQLAGQGEAGFAGGPHGDLFVEIVVKPHKTFTRRGDDLHCSVAVPMTSAALGASLKVETFDGEREVDLSPGTQPGHVAVLRGLGATQLRGKNRGDLHVHIEVQTPTKLSEEQASLLRQLAALRGEEQPEVTLMGTQPKVISKLKDIFGGR